MFGLLVPVIRIAAVAIIAAAAVIVIKHVIKEADIRREARKRKLAKDAFRAEILKRKKNAVDVGIFDKKNIQIDTFTLNSDEGISKELKKGYTINL